MAELPPLENGSSAKAAAPASLTPNKFAIYLIAILVFIVMVAWVGFLGWGVFAILEWIVQFTKNGLSLSTS